jgi:hypothetical protein
VGASPKEAVKAPQLGAKATRRVAELAKQGKSKTAIKQIVKKATALAVKRDDRLVRVEYILVADGTLTEKDFGSDKANTMRRRFDTRKPRPKKAKATPKAQPRKSRTRAAAKS